MGKISTSFFIYLLLHFSVFAELPNVFSPGEIVSSSKVNENFNYLDNRTHDNFDGSVLYFTANKYDGNLGGRVGADLKCKSDPINFFLNKIKNNCKHRAILTFSEDDEIRDMVDKYGINLTKTLVDITGHFSENGLNKLFNDNDWPFETSDMLVKISDFWTGSYSGGRISGLNYGSFYIHYTCNGFSDNSSSSRGNNGDIGVGQPDGIFFEGIPGTTFGYTCDTKLRFLCLCY